MRLARMLVVVAAAACGGLGCSKDADRVDDLYGSVSTELCKYVFNCCESSELGFFQSIFADQAGCEGYLALLLQGERDTYRLAVGKGGVSIEGGALDACLTALRGLACNTIKINQSSMTPPFSGTSTAVVEACTMSKIFVGQRGAGQACETALDCAAGTYCYSSGVLKDSGVCTTLRKLGQPCSSSKECDTGLTCSHPTNKYATCQTPAQEGQSCKEVSCDTTQADLFCDSSKDYRNPVCTRRVRKAEGEVCVTSSDCVKGLYCDYSNPTSPTSRVCARYHKGGEACTSSMQCESGRCDLIAKICIGAFCDGKNNGPPPQLDSGVYDLRRDQPRFGDWRQPDWRPPYPDLPPRVEKKPYPDAWLWPDQRKPDLLQPDTKKW